MMLLSLTTVVLEAWVGNNFLSALVMLKLLDKKIDQKLWKEFWTEFWDIISWAVILFVPKP